MVVLVFSNVVLRYGFNSSIPMSEEVSRWLFVWMTFLGSIVAMQKKEHLGIDMIVERLPVLGQKIVLAVGHLLMLGVLWLLFSGGLEQVRLNVDVGAPATGAPVAILYASAVVFSTCAAAILVLNLSRLLAGRLDQTDLVMVRGSEETFDPEVVDDLKTGHENDAAPAGEKS
jgi:TRAP-type C4-dicarboxylate transport system permease small subunit